MNAVTMNVYISALGDPCTITNNVGSGIPYAWSVAVLHCDGRVLNWAEGRYRFHHDEPWIPIANHVPVGGGTAGWWYEMIPTRNGHVEIELPPGEYMVVGSMHTWFVNGVLHGNWATDRAIVTACCSEDICVRLYASSMQPCNVIFHEFVLPMLIQNKVIARDTGEAVIKAMRRLYDEKTLSDFERGQLGSLRRAFAQMDKPSPHEPKGKGRGGAQGKG